MFPPSNFVLLLYVIHIYIWKYVKQCMNKPVRFPHPWLEICAAGLWEDNSPWVFPPVCLPWPGRWSSRLTTFPVSWLRLRTPSQEEVLENSCSGAPSPSDLRSDRSLNLQEIEMNSQNCRKTERTLLWASQTQWLPKHCQGSGIQHTKKTVAGKNDQEYE